MGKLAHVRMGTLWYWSCIRVKGRSKETVWKVVKTVVKTGVKFGAQEGRGFITC